MLAGGRSTRMGCDKALLPFRGASLAVSVARAVHEAARSATIVGDPERYGALGFPAIPDLFPGEGPLGGILTALSHTTAEWNLITACDMPEISPVFLSRLFEAAEQTQSTAMLPRGPSGLPEPLCAVYRRDALAPLLAVFQTGVRKITAALEAVAVTYLPVVELKPLQNVNTPEEWAGYAAG